MTTREILIAARKRIEDPNDWGKARGEYPSEAGKITIVNACWLDGTDWSERRDAHSALRAQIPEGGYLADFNDNHTHDEVLALFDRAIEELLKKGAQHDDS